MDRRFNQWRDSSSFAERNSIVISDSDEDAVENVEKEKIFVIDSSENSANVSRSSTPKAWLSKEVPVTESVIKRNLRKYISDDSDSEDHIDEDVMGSDEETKTEDEFGKGVARENNVETSCDSNDSNIRQEYVNDIPISTDASEEETDKLPIFLTTSNSNINVNEEDSSESEVAISLAKKEIGVGNIDPLVAQKRAFLVCKMEQLVDQLNKTKLLFSTGNMDLLPDKGDKLRKSIALQEKELEEIQTELDNTPLIQKTDLHSPKQEVSVIRRDFNTEGDSYSNNFSSYNNVDDIPLKPKSSSEVKELGKQAQATLSKELSLTVDRLQDLHGSLVTRPSEEERAEDPLGLKVRLMPHQQHALAWLMWREQQKPPGGVLADDMGLGKTLTMISLIIADIAKKRSKNADDESDEEWTDYNKPLRHKGGTLVVCPASLLSQWENEIKNRCKRGTLSTEVYHGTNRENVPKRLAKYDVVITTYNILTREFKTKSMVYKIQWERVILDEAHVVRNHKSQVSESVCGLATNKRWALTGTPIQNREMDLYSILKFLKCSPFDDLRVWKRWVDNKNAAGRQRLATVMKTLMLRRTKQELQLKGALECLPEKFIEEVFVKLDSQEQLVYEKVLIYSRTLFAQFLAQRAEKDHMAELASGMYDAPTFLSNPNKNTQFTKAQKKLLSLHADVKSFEILVLLLRLRQICVHPALIHSMLDQEDMKESGIMETVNVDSHLLNQINNISFYDSENNEENKNEQETGVNSEVTTNLLTSKNPVFQSNRESSKMKVILQTVEEILKKNDKVIIVSQWTSMLDIVASHLPSLKHATFEMFTGNIPIKKRQGIMDSFNCPDGDPRILLLSLTAGGVGLNLVGGNHLLLIDIHWNPQLEVQAQDRIYRFGQKKNVFIYKFICKDTIEERIKQLQEKKMDIARNVLTGDKNSTASKLTLNDLKSLFAL